MLQGRAHVQAELVAIELPGAIGEVAELEVGQPEIGQVGEGTVRSEHSAAPKPRPREQALPEALASLLRGASADPDLPHSAIRVAHAGLGDGAPIPTPDRDCARRADRGAWTPGHHRPPLGCRCSSADSIRANQASISLMRNRSSRPTLKPFGPRP